MSDCFSRFVVLRLFEKNESAELIYNLCEHFQKGTKLDLRPNIQLIDFDKFDLKKLSESEINSMVEKKQGFVQLNDSMRMCKNFGNKTFNTIETSSFLNLGVKEMFEMAIRSALRV
jgi:Ni,Fe-hydrogenase III large subunit